MKNRIKDGLIYVYIILICFFSSSRFDTLQEVVYLLAFVAVTVALYLIKNRYVAYVLSISLLVGCSVYNVNCALYIIPAFLLVVIYKSVMKKIRMADGKKKRNSEINHIWLHLLLALGVAEGIYALIKFFDSDYQSFIGETDVAVIVAEALVAVFVLGCFSGKVKTKVRNIHKITNRDYLTLNLINFIGVFLFAVAVFLGYATAQELPINISMICFPWSVWLVVLIYEKNPITETIFILIEEELKKISERRIKEK